MTPSKFLTERERLELLDATKDFQTERDSFLIRLALATGARASELLNIEAKDLNLERRSVFIRGLKGSNDRELPLKRDLFDSALKFIPLGIGYQRLNHIWAYYRPPGKTFHCLRHTFALRAYEKTKDILLVKAALGHRSLTNTMVYLEYSHSQKSLLRLTGL